MPQENGDHGLYLNYNMGHDTLHTSAERWRVGVSGVCGETWAAAGDSATAQRGGRSDQLQQPQP